MEDELKKRGFFKFLKFEDHFKILECGRQSKIIEMEDETKF